MMINESEESKIPSPQKISTSESENDWMTDVEEQEVKEVITQPLIGSVRRKR